MFTLYRTLKVVTGMMTALPLFSFGYQRLTAGETIFGGGLLLVGAAVYFFPGWILDKYIEKIKATIPFI